MPRAWVIHSYSGYQGLSLEEFDEEVPGPGQIRLKIEAFALNWGDKAPDGLSAVESASI